MKKLCLVLVAVAILALSADGGSPQPSGECEAVLFAKDVMMPMRDGVKLATDIYRPRSERRAGRRSAAAAAAADALQQGRGTARRGRALLRAARLRRRTARTIAAPTSRRACSDKYVGFGKDAYDTIDYLSKLPYTNGAVGMWGTSYAAHSQASAAITHHPALKTVMINCGGLYSGWEYKIRNHGAFELAQQSGLGVPAGRRTAE